MQEITLYQIFDWFEKRNTELPIIQYKNTILESNLNFSLEEAYKLSLFGFSDKGDEIYRNLKILSIFATRLLLIYQEAKDRGLYNNIGDREVNEEFNKFIAQYDLLSILECLKCKKLDERQTKWLIKELGLEKRQVSDCIQYEIGGTIGIDTIGEECGIIKSNCSKFVICNKNIATIDIKFVTVIEGDIIYINGDNIDPIQMILGSTNPIQESNRFANFINSSYSDIMANTNNTGTITLLFDKTKWREELCDKLVSIGIIPVDNAETSVLYYPTGSNLVCCIPECATCCEEVLSCGSILVDNTKSIIALDSSDLLGCNPCCRCNSNFLDGCYIMELIESRINSKYDGNPSYLWKEPSTYTGISGSIEHATTQLLYSLGLENTIIDTDCYVVRLYIVDFFSDDSYKYIRGISYAVISLDNCGPSYGGIIYMKQN